MAHGDCMSKTEHVDQGHTSMTKEQKPARAVVFWVRIGLRSRIMARYANPRTGYHTIRLLDDRTIIATYNNGTDHTLEIGPAGITKLDGDLIGVPRLDQQLIFSF